MKILQVAQRATDLQRATAFYTTLLGQPPVASFDPPGLVFFDVAGTRLVLDRAAPSALIYLTVPDVRVSVATLRADGVVIETEPHLIFMHEDAALGPTGTAEWQAFVRDSEGNLVGLVSHLPPE